MEVVIVLKHLRALAVKSLSKCLDDIFRTGSPACNLALCDLHDTRQTANPLSILENIIGNGFLWAVPKKRRSAERRATRRMGFGKLLVPKKNITTCQVCGSFHELHTVCGTCYEKVRKETEFIQKEIKANIGIKPFKKDVILLYENDCRNEDIIAGKNIVEMPKKRPPWFSKNLLIKDSETLRQKESSVGKHRPQPFVKDSK